MLVHSGDGQALKQEFETGAFMAKSAAVTGVSVSDGHPVAVFAHGPAAAECLAAEVKARTITSGSLARFGSLLGVTALPQNLPNAEAGIIKKFGDKNVFVFPTQSTVQFERGGGPTACAQVGRT